MPTATHEATTAADGRAHLNPNDDDASAGLVDDRSRPLLKTFVHFIRDGFILSTGIIRSSNARKGASASASISTTLLGVVVATAAVLLLLL